MKIILGSCLYGIPGWIVLQPAGNGPTSVVMAIRIDNLAGCRSVIVHTLGGWNRRHVEEDAMACTASLAFDKYGEMVLVRTLEWTGCY